MISCDFGVIEKKLLRHQSRTPDEKGACRLSFYRKRLQCAAAEEWIDTHICLEMHLKAFWNVIRKKKINCMCGVRTIKNTKRREESEDRERPGAGLFSIREQRISWWRQVSVYLPQLTAVMASVEIAHHLQEIIFAFGHFCKSLRGSGAVYGEVGSTVLWITRSTVKNCFCSLHLYYGYWIWFKRSWHQRAAQRFIIREVQCISLWTGEKECQKQH